MQQGGEPQSVGLWRRGEQRVGVGVYVDEARGNGCACDVECLGPRGGTRCVDPGDTTVSHNQVDHARG